MTLERYKRNEMGMVWSDLFKFLKWLQVEFMVIEARSEMGEIPFPFRANVLEGLIENLIIPAEIDRIESEITKHDVTAFVRHVTSFEEFPEELKPWFHQRMTSYDTQDTALMLILKESIKIIRSDLEAVLETLFKLAHDYKDTPKIGRTHGIHAEPITFGVELANWYDEFRRNIYRLEKLEKTVSVMKLSGAVGMYTLSPQVEERVGEKLGLKPIITTQIIARDIIAEYVTTMGIIAGTVGKVCTTLRGLARTEIREVMEYFDPNQTGSSAMPHKKNPIGWENITGICRDIQSRTFTAYQNQISWDQRDLANSSAERVMLSDISIYLDYALRRFNGSIKKMIVNPKKMLKNIGITNGLVFSQEVVSLLTEKKGLPREVAYEMVRKAAMICWEEDYEKSLVEALTEDPDVMVHVSAAELEACTDLKEKLKYTDNIFFKVFGFHKSKTIL